MPQAQTQPAIPQDTADRIVTAVAHSLQALAMQQGNRPPLKPDLRRLLQRKAVPTTQVPVRTHA